MTGANHFCLLPSHSPGPRLVFNRVNGRRPLTTSPSLEGTQETYTVAHEENVRFVSEGSKGPGGCGSGHRIPVVWPWLGPVLPHYTLTPSSSRARLFLGSLPGHVHSLSWAGVQGGPQALVWEGHQGPGSF